MARSKFEGAWEGFLDLIGDGVTFKDACREIGVQEKTVRNWLSKGRKEDDGLYAEFAAIFDTTRQEVEGREKPMDRDELMLVVSKAARKGSVQAMKLMEEMLRRGNEGDEETNPFGELDAGEETPVSLAERRAAKGG